MAETPFVGLLGNVTRAEPPGDETDRTVETNLSIGKAEGTSLYVRTHFVLYHAAGVEKTKIVSDKTHNETAECAVHPELKGKPSEV